MAENNEITAVPSPSSSSSDPPTEQKVKKKKFLNLFGIIKSKDKKDKEALKVPDRNSKDDKKNDIKNLFKPPAEGAITDRGEEKKEEKKVLIVSTIEELPDDCQKWIKHSGLPHEKLIANFEILLQVLHFRTGIAFKTPESAVRSPLPPLPKSTRFKSGEELLTEAVEFKKLYKELDEVGKGGFGTVFHARTVKDKKIVAIKKMPHTTSRQKANNFHEASILHALDHPNIVKYLTCHEIKDDLWLVMEFLEGGTFEEAARAWRFNETNLAYVARELLKGLSYMHSRQLAHRDLKSANIMMSVQGAVKLIDFGLAADMSVGFPSHMVGSPFWMPPEMIQGKPHTYAVDIWSCAISLLEMANQRPPMMESAVKAMFTVATEGATQLFVEPDRWSPVFNDFLSRCLQVDPEKRSTADELLLHEFIKQADTRANMEQILRRIFLSNSLLNSGF